MAMKKAELEAHREEYLAALNKARSAVESGEYRKAIIAARSAWAFIDGMMQFERRFNGNEFRSIEAIDIVLEYAPLLFDSESLSDLEDLLKRTKRIEKNTFENINDRLSASRSTMYEAHEFWVSLEVTGDDESASVTASVSKKSRARITQKWEQMGVVQCPGDAGDCVRLSTSMDSVFLAKCPHCGVVARAPKVKFLTEQRCPKCKKTSYFVLLTRSPEKKT